MCPHAEAILCALLVHGVILQVTVVCDLYSFVCYLICYLLNALVQSPSTHAVLCTGAGRDRCLTASCALSFLRAGRNLLCAHPNELPEQGGMAADNMHYEFLTLW